MTRTLLLALALTCAAPPPLVAQEPPPDRAREEADRRLEDRRLQAAARDLVARYLDLIQMKRPQDALALWSFAPLGREVFGGDLFALTSEERAACVRGLRQLLLQAMSDPAAMEYVRQAALGELEVDRPVGGRVRVCVRLTPPEPADAQPVLHYLWVELEDGKARLVDMAARSPARRLALQLAPRWRRVHELGISDPLAYVEAMVRRAERLRGQ
ncbi:MAG: hypothetical protein AB7N76_10350 [Planctomycetota bacterium]